MFLISIYRRFVCVVALSAVFIGCQGDERLAEKARIEGKETAQTELQSQIDNLDKKIAIARAEGKATALAELQAQIDNLELVVQKARAEGRAQAEAEINASNSNLSAKAQLMEADLAIRHLFYQALKGSYEGVLATERGEFNIRITLVPSLPPVIHNRVRQLEEITSDLNNLYFHVQVLQWNPSNRLSSVGCRVENIRPDINKGEISITSSNCPNLYRLRIVDPELERPSSEGENPYSETTDPVKRNAQISAATAASIREGRISELPEIRGEVHPTTNASIYKLSVKRSGAR